MSTKAAKKTARKRMNVAWYVQPLNAMTNGIVAGRIDASEEKERREVNQKAGTPFNIYFVGLGTPALHIIESLRMDRSDLNLKFQIFTRTIGEHNLRNVTGILLSRKKRKKTPA